MQGVEIMARLSKTVAAGLAVAAFSMLGATGAVQADGQSEAFEKCAKIKDADARLTCFDAVTAALKDRPAPDRTAGSDAEEAAAAERRRREQAELARREAELEKAEAELARREAEAERARAAERAAALEAERESEAAELERREAELARREAELEERRRAEEARAAEEETRSAEDEFGAGEDEEQLERFTSKVVDHGTTPTGKVWVELENGQKWRQKDSIRVRFRSSQENFVTIRRGLLGSFLMRVNDKGRSIRVHRVR